MANRRYGFALVALSALLWSTAGLFVRMADLDAWTIVAWRSLFAFVTLAALWVAQNRSGLSNAVPGIGLTVVPSVVLAVVSTFAYVIALRLTTVANVMTVYAALPFIATAIAFVWLRERATRRFMVAGSVALAGIAVTAGAAASSQDTMGILAALVMTAGFAAQLVHTRRHPGLDTALASALAAGACMIIAVPLAQPGIPAPVPLIACALFGVLTTGLGYVLVLAGGRLIAPGEAGLISLLDVVLGPLWVWLVFLEKPAPASLAGGAAVLLAVIWYLATSGSPEEASV